MAERYSFVTSFESMKAQLGDIEIGSDLRISYNIAPTQHAYVITNANPERIQYVTWGLVPSTSRDGVNTGKLINAQQENISTSPSFRMPFRTQRCLILADSFYAWQKDGLSSIPHRIQLPKGELMLIAGVWDVWYNDDYKVKSFSVVTTLSKGVMKEIQPRMPVVLSTKEKQEQWLHGTDLHENLRLLQDGSEEIFSVYQISSKIDSISINGPELHARLGEFKSKNPKK